MAGGATFGQLLREFRSRARQTQQQRALGAGLSISAIQSYEGGRRRPGAAVTERLRASLGLDESDRDRFRRAAGLPSGVAGLKAAMFNARGAPNSVWDEVQSCDWTSLVINERKEVVAWNRLANRVGEIDLATLSQFQRSVLRMAATEHFDRHLTNWRELIGRLVSVANDEGGNLAQDAPAPYLQAVLEDIGAEDPRFLPVIFDLVISAPPWRAAGRNVHPIRWRLDDGTELAFHGAFGDWSDYDGLWSFDWHAADAATASWVRAALAADVSDDVADFPAPKTRPFRNDLPLARANARMSRSELARCSGVAAASIAAYERGQRAPSRPALLALCHALTIDGYTINRYMREAGFEEEPSDAARWLAGESPVAVFRGRKPVRGTSAAAIFREADTLSWPCVVLDAGGHAVHANPRARRIVDPARWPVIPGRPGPHLMQLMASRQFRDQLGNWETVAAITLPGRLDVQLLGRSGLQSPTGVRAVAEYLRTSDPEGLARLLEVWSNSGGFDSLRRVGVRFEWRTEQGDALAFNCVLCNWNAHDPYKAMDLFPADAATFAWLDRE